MSDNRSQYPSSAFALFQFAEMYGFHHVMRSLKFAQSNCEVEHAVQTGKKTHKENHRRPLPCLGVLPHNPHSQWIQAQRNY